MLTKMTQLKTVISFLLFFACVTLHGQVVLLKDGSVLNGTVINDTENEVQIILLNGDTLDFSRKSIDAIISKEAYKESYLNHRTIPRHKTQGWFINAEILANPFAISAGKRLNKNWNVGGTIFYGSPHLERNFGIAPYFRYYIGDNLFNSRFFLDSFIGVSLRKNDPFFSRDYNDYPVTGSLGVGIQLPNTKDFRFYFKIGFFSTYDKIEFLGSSSELITQTGLNTTAHISLIAIQF